MMDLIAIGVAFVFGVLVGVFVMALNIANQRHHEEVDAAREHKRRLDARFP